MAVVDILTKGSITPYINCKAITLRPPDIIPHFEDTAVNTPTKVVLSLEILQNKQQLLKSNWLNNLSVGGAKLLDSMFLQIVPFYDKENVSRLRASSAKNYATFDTGEIRNPRHGVSERVPSVYMAQQFLGDGYLPRGTMTQDEEAQQIAGTNTFVPTSLREHGGWHPGLFSQPFAQTVVSQFMDTDWTAAAVHGSEAHRAGVLQMSIIESMKPVQLTTSTLIGHKSSDPIKVLEATFGFAFDYDAALFGGLNKRAGIVREETRHGIEYYVIPIEKTMFLPAVSGLHNLGFLFYSFLSVPHFFSSLTDFDIDPNLYKNYTESLTIEGPINTEIVMLDGEIIKEKEVFRLPNNEVWNGPVHVHLKGINPGPGGYAGTGGFGHNQGWMAGAKHGPNQPRLALELTKNDIVQDFRGLEGTDPLYNNPDAWKVTPWSSEADGTIHSIAPEDVVSVEQLLSPFEKTTRKYLRKYDVSPSNAGGQVLYDNDDEYSKLYITRDQVNIPQGVFLIDFKRLLKNNSHLFPLLRTPCLEGEILQDHSKLLQLKLYRDRVKNKPVSKVYENYANDTFYEEPSKLVGVVGDLQSWDPASSYTSGALKEVVLDSNNTTVRCFSFTDQDAKNKTAGHYRYRLEMSFKDGTYAYLINKMNTLVRTIQRLNIVRDFMHTGYRTTINKTYPAGPSSTTVEEYENKLSSAEKTKLLSLGSVYAKSIYTPFFVNNLATDKGQYESAFNSNFGTLGWNSSAAAMAQNARDIMELFFRNYEAGVCPPKPTSWENYGEVTSEALGTTIETALLGIGTSDLGPEQLGFMIQILDKLVRRLEDLTGATKLKKSKSELADLDVPSGYNIKNISKYVISPGDSTIEEDYTFDHPSEIFKATDNGNVYIDYLSTRPSTPLDYPKKLRTMSPQQYIRRCMLDTIKYTMRVSGESYSTALNSLYSTNITEEWAPGLPDDDWGRTILSYLTPSEIRVASPSRPSVDPWYGVDTKNKEYNYRYLAFNPAAHNDQKGGVKPANYLMGGFYSTTRNQDLVLQIIDYNIHKNEKTDSTTPNMIYDNMPGNSNKDQNLMARESYKKLFSDIGLTMHETSKYEDTFDRPAGAYSKTPTNVPDPTDTQIHELYGTEDNPHGLSFDYYSDGKAKTDIYYSRFIAGTKQSFFDFKTPMRTKYPSPAGSAGSSEILGLPNIFKARYYSSMIPYVDKESHMIAQGTAPLRSSFSTACRYSSTPAAATNPLYTWFMIVNLNYTAKIEVFTGFNTSYGPPLKEDTGNWRLLNMDDVQNLDMANDSLLCRIGFYDEKLVKGIEIPILNKYFLIGDTGVDLSSMLGPATY